MISVESTKICSCMSVTPRSAAAIGPRTVLTVDKCFLNGTLGVTGSNKGDFVMKKVLAFCILAAVPLLAGEGALTDSERSFLVEQLQLSKKAFLASIGGVTEAQWKFKASPTSWSVAECAEHIVLSEDFLFQTSQGILKTPVV